MITLLFSGIIANEETKLMNMTLFFDGTWNATAGTLDSKGDFVPDNKTFLNVTFDINENDPWSLTGHMTGFNPGLDLKIIIDKSNDQKFTILSTNPPFTKVLAQSEMLYSPRKMPHAAGTWGSNTTHFKLVILDAHIAELQIFREGIKAVRIYRFMKTPRPYIPSVWTALRAPLFVGFFFIAFRLMEAHEVVSLGNKSKKSEGKEGGDGNAEKGQGNAEGGNTKAPAKKGNSKKKD